MIPFFQSNTFEDKYITETDDIERFFDQAMEEERLFQLSISGLSGDAVSRIVSIDRHTRKINFEDPTSEIDDIVELNHSFSVTAEVRADNQIMRFESEMLRDTANEHRFVVSYPREIERNIKRQAPRFKPNEGFVIPVSFVIQGNWHQVAVLADISTKGLGFIIDEKYWRYIEKGLHTQCKMNIENILTFTCSAKVMHTFTVFKTGNKHGGAQFMNLELEQKKELFGLIREMQEHKIIST